MQSYVSGIKENVKIRQRMLKYLVPGYDLTRSLLSLYPPDSMQQKEMGSQERRTYQKWSSFKYLTPQNQRAAFPPEIVHVPVIISIMTRLRGSLLCLSSLERIISLPTSSPHHSHRKHLLAAQSLMHTFVELKRTHDACAFSFRENFEHEVQPGGSLLTGKVFRLINVRSLAAVNPLCST